MKKQMMSIFFLVSVMPISMAFGQTTDQRAPSAPKDAVLEHWNTYTNPPSSAVTDPDLTKEYQFQLSSEFSYVAYKEPGLSVKENGPFYGIEGAYEWRPPEAQTWTLNVLHLDSHFNFGAVDYKSPSGTFNNLDDFLMEPRAWVGRDFSPFDLTRLTPYIGLGYRLLFDHLGAVSDDGGYDRLSNYIYAPVGFEMETACIPGWILGFSTEYDIFIQGWQESYLSDINNSYPNINNEQTRGFGVRGSFDIVKRMRTINILVSPYVRYWNVHQSKTSTAYSTNGEIEFVGYEPTNHSTEIGIKLGVQF